MQHYSRRNNHPLQDHSIPLEKDVSRKVGDGGDRNRSNIVSCGPSRTPPSDLYELQDANGYLQKRIRDLEVVLRDNGFDVDGNRLRDRSLTDDDGEMMAMMGMDPEPPTPLTKYMETKIAELIRENDTLESQNEVLTAQVRELQSVVNTFQGMRPINERESMQSRGVDLTTASSGEHAPTCHTSTVSSRGFNGHKFDGETLDSPRSTLNVVPGEGVGMASERIDEMMKPQQRTVYDGVERQIENNGIEIRFLDVKATESQSGGISQKANDANPYQRDKNLLGPKEMITDSKTDWGTELALANADKVALIHRVSELECAVEETTTALSIAEEKHRTLSAYFEQQRVMIDELREENRKLYADFLSSKNDIVQLQDVLSEKRQADIDGAERIQYLQEQLGQQSTTIEEDQRHRETDGFEKSRLEGRIQELLTIVSTLEHKLGAQEREQVTGITRKHGLDVDSLSVHHTIQGGESCSTESLAYSMSHASMAYSPHTPFKSPIVPTNESGNGSESGERGSERTNSTGSVSSWAILSMTQTTPSQRAKRKKWQALVDALPEKASLVESFHNSLDDLAGPFFHDDLDVIFKTAAEFCHDFRMESETDATRIFESDNSMGDRIVVGKAAQKVRMKRKRRFSDGGAFLFRPSLPLESTNQREFPVSPLERTAFLLVADEEITHIIQASEELLGYQLPGDLVRALKGASMKIAQADDSPGSVHSRHSRNRMVNRVAEKVINYQLVDDAACIYGQTIPPDIVSSLRASSSARSEILGKETFVMEKIKERLEQELLDALITTAGCELGWIFPDDLAVSLRTTALSFKSLLQDVTDYSSKLYEIHVDFHKLEQMFKKADALHVRRFPKEVIVALRKASFALQSRLAGTDFRLADQFCHDIAIESVQRNCASIGGTIYSVPQGAEYIGSSSLQNVDNVFELRQEDSSPILDGSRSNDEEDISPRKNPLLVGGGKNSGNIYMKARNSSRSTTMGLSAESVTSILRASPPRTPDNNLRTADEDLGTVHSHASQIRLRSLSPPRYSESDNEVERGVSANLRDTALHPPIRQLSIPVDDHDESVIGTEKTVELRTVGMNAASIQESLLGADVVEQEIRNGDGSIDVTLRSSDRVHLSLGEKNGEDEESEEMKSFDMSKASDVSLDLFAVFNPSESSELGKMLRRLGKLGAGGEPSRKIESSIEGEGKTNSNERSRNPTESRRHDRAKETKHRPQHSGDQTDIRSTTAHNKSQPRVRRTKSADSGLEELASRAAAKKLGGSSRKVDYLDFIEQAGSDDLAVIYKSAVNKVDTDRHKICTPDYWSSMSNGLRNAFSASKCATLNTSFSNLHRANIVANVMDSVISDTEETYGIEIPIPIVEAVKKAVCEAVPDDSLLSIVRALHNKDVLSEAESCYGKTIPIDLVEAMRATSLPPGISAHALEPQFVIHAAEGNTRKDPEPTPRCLSEYLESDHPKESGLPLHPSNYKTDEATLDTSLNPDNSWGKLSFSPSEATLMETKIVEDSIKLECKPESTLKNPISHREKKRKAELKLSNSLADFGGDADDLKLVFLQAKKTLNAYNAFTPTRNQDSKPPSHSSQSLKTTKEDSAEPGIQQLNLDTQALPVLRPIHSVSCVAASPQDLEMDLLLSAMEEIQGFKLEADLDIALRKASRTIDESLDFVAPMSSHPKAQFGKYLPSERMEILLVEAEIFLGHKLPEGTIQLIRAQADMLKLVLVPQTGNDCSSWEQEVVVDFTQKSNAAEVILDTSLDPLLSITGGREDNLEELYMTAYPVSPRVQILSPPPKEREPPPPPDFNALSASISKKRSLNMGRSTIVVPGHRESSSPQPYPVSLQTTDTLVNVTLGAEDDLGKLYKTAYDEAPRTGKASPPSPALKSPPKPRFLSPKATAKTRFLDDLKSPPLSNRTPILSTFLELNRNILLERTQSGREIPLLSPVTEPTWGTDGGTNHEGTKRKQSSMIQKIPDLDIDVETAVGEGFRNDPSSVIEEPSVEMFRELEAIFSESQKEIGADISEELLAALKYVSSSDADMDSMDDTVLSSVMMSLIDVEQDDHSSKEATLCNLHFNLNRTKPLNKDQSLVSSFHSYADELRKKLSLARKTSITPLSTTKLQRLLDALINMSETELGRPIPPKIVKGICNAARAICSKSESGFISWEELELILHDVCKGYDAETWFETQEAFFKAWEKCRNPRLRSNPSQIGHSSGYFSAVSESESSVSVLIDDPEDFDRVEDIIAEVHQVNGAVPEDLVHKLTARSCEAQIVSDSGYSEDTDDSKGSEFFKVSSQTLEFDYSQSTFNSGVSVPPPSRSHSSELKNSNGLQPATRLDIFVGEIEGQFGRPLPSEISGSLRAAHVSSGRLNFDYSWNSAMNESGELHGLALVPEQIQAMRRTNSMCSESGSLSCAQSIVSTLASSDPPTSCDDNSGDESLDGTANMDAENMSRGTSRENVSNNIPVAGTKQGMYHRWFADPAGPLSLPPARPSLERSLSAHSALSNQSGRSITSIKYLGPRILKELRKVEQRQIPFELGFALKHSGAIPYSMNSDEDLGIIIREYESLSGKRLPADLVLAVREASVAIRTPSSSLRSRRSRMTRQSSGSFRSTSRSSAMPSILESDDVSSRSGTETVSRDLFAGGGLAEEAQSKIREFTRTDSADPGIAISGFEEKAGLGGYPSNGNSDDSDDEYSVSLSNESEDMKPEMSYRNGLSFSNSTSTQLVSNRFVNHQPSNLELRTIHSIVSTDSTIVNSIGELTSSSSQSNTSDFF